MTAREFFYLVCQMRGAQKTYFKDRTQQNLRICKALEGDVDREIDRVRGILAQQELGEG